MAHMTLCTLSFGMLVFRYTKVSRVVPIYARSKTRTKNSVDTL